MEQYLIDTNIVSDFFSASLPVTEQNVKDFIADGCILDIDPNVIACCVSLRRNKKIKTT